VAIILHLGFLAFRDPIAKRLDLDSKGYSLDYKIQNTANSSRVLAATNIPLTTTKMSYKTYDYRARVFDLYFKKEDSPLYGKGQSFIDACDKYGAPKDCTLLPAIARIETNLCRTGISYVQFNCWGYGGSGENRINYPNYESAIDEITRRLMQGYTIQFFEDPEYGELTYCGPHCYRWGDHVKQVQTELKLFAKEQGYEL